MKITIIGTGYVGLVSGTCFAEFGVKVVCVDKDTKKINNLKKGVIPIFEPGLNELVKKNVQANRLSFETDIGNSIDGSDAIFIAVGTPSRKGDGHADLSYVFSAAEDIAKKLNHFAVIVNKSTVPIGTGKKVYEIIKEINPELNFEVASNPEFLREGSAIDDFMRPDRVVIGCESEKAKDILKELYRPLFLLETPILFTKRETAEMIKYAANSFLATKITFINEIADLCEKVGANVSDVSTGIGLDGRIGKKFLHPGPGYGGSCFPKDTLALVRTAQDYDTDIGIVDEVVAYNTARKLSMAQRVEQAAGGSVDGKTIAVLGLAFKPETDDMRDSPSLDIIPALMAAGASIRAYDPKAMEEARHLLPAAVALQTSAQQCLEGAVIAVIITEWNEFRALTPDQFLTSMAGTTLVDLRNIYDPSAMRGAGLTYLSIGRD